MSVEDESSKEIEADTSEDNPDEDVVETDEFEIHIKEVDAQTEKEFKIQYGG